MSSLLRTIQLKWAEDSTLEALIPVARVYTGRVPQTEIVNFPYVSVKAAQGGRRGRSDKKWYSFGPLSFHVWVEEDQLEFAHNVAEAISDCFADKCWNLSETGSVTDVLDEGEPMAHQTRLPAVRVWELVKLFTVYIERDRTDPECCPESTYYDEASSYTDPVDSESSSSS